MGLEKGEERRDTSRQGKKGDRTRGQELGGETERERERGGNDRKMHTIKRSRENKSTKQRFDRFESLQ